MQDLLNFLNRSPSRYHAVDNLCGELEAAGYVRLYEGQCQPIVPGGKYYAVRGGSALIAFEKSCRAASLRPVWRRANARLL